MLNNLNKITLTTRTETIANENNLAMQKCLQGKNVGILITDMNHIMHTKVNN